MIWLGFMLQGLALLLLVLAAFNVMHEKVQLLPLALALALVSWMVLRGLPP